MFTGIVETQGRIARLEDGAELRTLEIEAPHAYFAETKVGDSIAVDGACLTAVEVSPRHIRVNLIRQTLDRTVAGGYGEGTRVNLERAMQLGARLDGHLVQGHVDGVGTLLAAEAEGEGHRLFFRIPEAVCRTTLLHGSITLNGVSLTVNDLTDPDRIEVGIIPHTWTHTNLSRLTPGDPVNVEGDLIGKYVARLLPSAS